MVELGKCKLPNVRGGPLSIGEGGSGEQTHGMLSWKYIGNTNLEAKTYLRW